MNHNTNPPTPGTDTDKITPVNSTAPRNTTLEIVDSIAAETQARVAVDVAHACVRIALQIRAARNGLPLRFDDTFTAEDEAAALWLVFRARCGDSTLGDAIDLRSLDLLCRTISSGQ